MDGNLNGAASRKSRGLMKIPHALALSLLIALPAGTLNTVAADPDKNAKWNRYDDHGLQFDYDRKLKVEAEQSDKVLTLNLKGRRELAFTIQVAELPLTGEAYAEAVLTGMRDGMNQGGAKVQAIQSVKKTIGNQERKGKAFEYKLIGSEFYYQAFGWDVEKAPGQKRVLFLSIQFPPKKEASLKPLIDPILNSLRWVPKE